MINLRVIVTAGGTGGHIYPALAIINKIKAKEPHNKVLYIGTHNRMEKDIVPNEGIDFIPLKIYGFNTNTPMQNIKNIFYIRKAYQKSLAIIKDFKPDIVIGVGGYIAYPVIKAAHKLGVKTLIHEQNAIPGKANKTLAKFTDAIAVSFPETKNSFPKNTVYVTGNPCGERALNIKKIPKSKYHLDINKKLVLVVAGSQGSPALNNKMKDFLLSLKNASYEVLYVTGKDFYNNFIKDTKFPNNVVVVPYINDLAGILKETDLVICRAGASTISEIIALNIPSIFIPSPYVPNNHQYYNALRLAKIKAGILLEEWELSKDRLIKEINALLENKTNYQTIKNNLKKIAVKNSSELIYNIVKDMIK